jgi:hypothetical protein
MNLCLCMIVPKVYTSPMYESSCPSLILAVHIVISLRMCQESAAGIREIVPMFGSELFILDIYEIIWMICGLQLWAEINPQIDLNHY